jgi:hypothetical protein
MNGKLGNSEVFLKESIAKHTNHEDQIDKELWLFIKACRLYNLGLCHNLQLEEIIKLKELSTDEVEMTFNQMMDAFREAKKTFKLMQESDFSDLIAKIDLIVLSARIGYQTIMSKEDSS